MDKNFLLSSGIPLDRIDLAIGSNTNLEALLNFITNKKEADKSIEDKEYDIGIIGAGDFASAFSISFNKNVNILIYDFFSIKSLFSQYTRLSTNKSFYVKFTNNINFTLDLNKVLNSKFILLGVPASALPSVINKIKNTAKETYKFKQYVLISKGLVGTGYIPHKFLEKEGIPFENIIWASGGNVAKDLTQKKALKISVVSINKNKRARKLFASYFNSEYLKAEQYSGSALLACELGGILKNYYAGFGRYLLIKHGEKILNIYKQLVRSEFRKAVRMISKSPKVSLRAWVIRKASHGPSFWEDLNVTIRNGRNGIFGEKIFNNISIQDAINSLGLVESFNSIFSTLSLFKDLKLKKLFILKNILELYETIHIEYLNNKDAVISEDGLKILYKLEAYVLKASTLNTKNGFLNFIKNLLKLN